MPRRLMLDLPTEEQRFQILQTLLEAEECEGVDVAQLAQETAGFTGAPREKCGESV